MDDYDDMDNNALDDLRELVRQNRDILRALDNRASSSNSNSVSDALSATSMESDASPPVSRAKKRAAPEVNVDLPEEDDPGPGSVTVRIKESDTSCKGSVQ